MCLKKGFFPMTSTATLKDLLAGVRVFADADAFRRDEFGRTEYLQMKPIHDELYQVAISLKLASALVVMQRRHPLPELRERFKISKARPGWHPANPSPSKHDLLIAPIAAFDRNWLGLRQLAESSPKSARPAR